MPAKIYFDISTSLRKDLGLRKTALPESIRWVWSCFNIIKMSLETGSEFSIWIYDQQNGQDMIKTWNCSAAILSFSCGVDYIKLLLRRIGHTVAPWDSTGNPQPECSNVEICLDTRLNARLTFNWLLLLSLSLSFVCSRAGVVACVTPRTACHVISGSHGRKTGRSITNMHPLNPSCVDVLAMLAMASPAKLRIINWKMRPHWYFLAEKKKKKI